MNPSLGLVKTLTKYCTLVCKTSSRPSQRLVQSTDLCSIYRQQTRNYAFKSELKIKWVRPEKIPGIKPEKSGDLGSVETPDLKQFPIEFKKSIELQDANDLVKKTFSLEFSPRNRAMEIFRKKTVDLVKRHPLDMGSAESKIASLTGDIRNLQQHMDLFPRDKVTKNKLQNMIDKRKKYLKYVRRWDYKRFEWLLEKLGLVYKPPPSEFKWVTRKDSLRKLTDKHCNDLRDERLNAYRASLEVQQLGFLQKKVETLQWIVEEEKACGVEPTVMQEEIHMVQEHIKELNTKQSEKCEENVN